jgi:uncharacterized Zn-binding protein involved in type VI secretion
MGLERAARVTDPIAHTQREGWGIVGALLGATVGVFIVILTAPVALPALAIAAGVTATIATTTVAGSVVGEMHGATIPYPAAGYITDGAATVFTGPEMHEAARMSDPVDCHPEKIADGSDSVFIEGWNAARNSDGTTCAGTISDGCESVLFGGERIGRAGTTERTELSGGYRATIKVIDWIGTIASLGSKVAIGEVALPLAGTAVKAYSETSPEAAQQGQVLGAIITGAQIVTGKRPSEWRLQDTADNAGAVVQSGTGVDSVLRRPAPPRTY